MTGSATPATTVLDVDKDASATASTLPAVANPDRPTPTMSNRDACDACLDSTRMASSDGVDNCPRVATPDQIRHRR
jgi:hypothetical protein